MAFDLTIQFDMRLHVLSDLHLEFAPFQLVDTPADAVIIAGDVHPGYRGIEWVMENFKKTPVIYVMGNHEFYGKDIPKLTLEFKERARGTNIHILENEAVEIDGISFLGATLWTDFDLYGDVMAGQAEAAFQMTDYRRIRLAPEYSKFRPRDSRRIHLETLVWLKQNIQSLAGQKTVMVSHHAPSPRSLSPKFKQRPLDPCYASNLEPLIESNGIALWVHGHIHHCSDYFVGTTRVISNPRGYPDDNNTNFNSSLVVEV